MTEKNDRSRVDGDQPRARPPAGSTASSNELTQEDVETLLVSAVRYALGRRSYIVGLTCDLVRKVHPSANCRDIIERDVVSARHHGDAMNEREWIALVLWLRESVTTVAAVDPQVTDTGTPTTRDGNS